MKSISCYLEEDREKWGSLPYVTIKKQGNFVSHTFHDVVSNVQNFARVLLTDGVCDNVMLYSENSYEWMIADLAILGYVGVCVPVDKEWTVFDLSHILSSLTVNTILFGKEKQNEITEIQKQFPQIRFLCLEDTFLKIRNADKLQISLSGIRDMTKTAMILFTSGTTNRPKAIPLTQANLLYNTNGLFARTPMSTDDVSYLCLPLHHVYAGVAQFLYTIVSGMQIYLCSDTSRILEELLGIRPSIVCAVPLILNRIYEKADKEVWEMLQNIRYLYCGGSFLEPKLKRAFIEHGVTLVEAYGMTEATGIAALADPSDDNIDCNGLILDGVNVRILNPDSDGTGEIIVGGGNVSAGYLFHNNAYSEFDNDGFYHTGDLGRVDESGHLYLSGRKKRLILTANGKNIYVEELEQLILEHPRIQSAVVFEEKYHPAARIYTSLPEADIQKYMETLNARLPKYKRIQTFYCLPVKKEGRVK